MNKELFNEFLDSIYDLYLDARFEDISVGIFKPAWTEYFDLPQLDTDGETRSFVPASKPRFLIRLKQALNNK